MDGNLIDRWFEARKALVLAEDSADWHEGAREASLARMELDALEARMSAEERLAAAQRFDAWYRDYLADDQY